MQTITVSIQGSVSVSESVQVSDEAALPLFIRLREVLGSGGAPKPRGRRRKSVGPTDEAGTAAEPAGASPEVE